MVRNQSGVNQLVELSRDEIRDRLNDPRLTLVNVLPRETFDAARIPGSINLPVAEINERARDVLPDVSQEIAVYCWSET
jgi:rhodanese-related sulfurtransferase